MKQFKDFEAAQEAAKYTGGEKLPAGAYVCKIKNVQYVGGKDGNSDMINLLFDITEGEYKDFFKKQYDNNSAEDKKWKGRATIYVPKDDGSEKDGWTKNSFAKWTNAFEDSNNGYKWDWDENKWKGLTVGIVFGETGSKIDGKDIVYTEARFACNVQTVRDGKAPEAKFKAKKGYGQTAPTGSEDFMKLPEGEEEIPF